MGHDLRFVEHPLEDPNPNKTMNYSKRIGVLAALLGSFALPNITAQVAPDNNARTTGDSAQTNTSTTASQEEVIHLSPFQVTESSAVGYVATSTLAGSRLNTQLRDVGAAVSVYTPELFADTGITSAAQLLTIAVGAEVGGSNGNFAGGGAPDFAGRPNQSEARENPQGNQRIRGVGPASLSRDYFLTDIPFDSYNISGVTINRGPNSLLFGVGNPAGVIEASAIKAQVSRNSYTTTARYGSNESYRGTFDLNQVLFKDRLAVRVAGVHDKNVYDQKPAYDRDERLYANIKAVIAKNKGSNILGELALSLSGETGRRNSTPVNVIPPTDSFSNWFTPLDPALDDLPGVTMLPQLKQGNAAYLWRPKATVDTRLATTAIPELSTSYLFAPYFVHIPLIYDTPGQTTPGFQGGNPALAGIAGIMGRVRYTVAANGRGPIDAASTKTQYQLISGFVTPTVQNRDIFDYRNRLISGTSNTVEQGFETANVVLTQGLLKGNAGIELAYDTQTFHSRRFLPFSFGGIGNEQGPSDISIDTSLYLTNDQPNPNVGRPFIATIGSSERYERTGRDSFRATAFYRLDFDKKDRRLFGIPLGTHTFTGLYSTQEIETRGEPYTTSWRSNTRDLNAAAFQTRPGDFRAQPIMVQYVGPAAFNANTVNDLRVTEVLTAPMPKVGDTFTATFFDFVSKRMLTEPVTIERILLTGNANRREFESKTGSIQSTLFRDHLVTLVGWRQDHLKTFSRAGDVLNPNGTWNPASYALSTTPSFDESVNSFNWSVVARYPEKLLGDLPLGLDLGFFYNVSENFNPLSVRTNLHGEVLPAPTGQTKEYGFLLEFLDRRASLRVNWYETQTNGTSNGANGATSGILGVPRLLAFRYEEARVAGIPISAIPSLAGTGYTSYDQLFTAFQNLLPEPTRSLANLRYENGAWRDTAIPGLTDTTNVTAKGVEIELVGNLTDHWRVSFNVAQQNTVATDSARLTKEVADALYANMTTARLLGISDAPALPQSNTAAVRYDVDVGSRLSATLARDGVPSQEQREWRANLVSAYDLAGTGIKVLKNVSVGTVARWQSKIAIGNPLLTGQRLKEKIVETDSRFTSVDQIPDNHSVMQTQYPDLENPFYGPGEFAGDFWISYKRKIFKNTQWQVQLNVQNAWGNEDDIPVIMNPDGKLAVIRIPNETRWYVTSTFKF